MSKMVKITADRTRLIPRGSDVKDLTDYSRTNGGFKVVATWEQDMFRFEEGEHEYPEEVLQNKNVKHAIAHGTLKVAMTSEDVDTIVANKNKVKIKEVKETKASPLEEASKDE